MHFKNDGEGRLSYYYYNWRCWKYRVWHPVVVTPLCPVNTFWRKRFWYVLLVNGMDEVFTLSFFQLMHLPLHASSKRKGLFDCFSSVIKNDLLQLFCRIPVKIGKMFPNSYIFINFVLFSSGKTKFSMASCLWYNWAFNDMSNGMQGAELRQRLLHLKQRRSLKFL